MDAWLGCRNAGCSSGGPAGSGDLNLALAWGGPAGPGRQAGRQVPKGGVRSDGANSLAQYSRHGRSAQPAQPSRRLVGERAPLRGSSPRGWRFTRGPRDEAGLDGGSAFLIGAHAHVVGGKIRTGKSAGVCPCAACRVRVGRWARHGAARRGDSRVRSPTPPTLTALVSFKCSLGNKVLATQK